MGIIERIKQFADYQGVSLRRFCETVGIANGSFTKVKSVGSENLLKIFYAYPEINLEWLITGEGAMIKSKQNTADSSVLLDVIREKDTRIEQLVRANERMSIELDLLKKNTVTSTVSSMDAASKDVNVDL